MKRGLGRNGWALVASVAIHALLLVFLLHTKAAPLTFPTAPVVVEVEVREVPAPRAKPPPPSAAPAASLPAPRVADKGEPARPHKAASAAPAPTAQAPEESGESGGGELIAGDVPRSAAGASGPGAASRGDLRDQATSSAGRTVESEEPEIDRQIAQSGQDRPGYSHRAIQAPSQVRDPNARVAALINSEEGARRVERGMIDPYFLAMRDSLKKGWNPDKLVTKKGVSGYMQNAGETVSDYTKAWLGAAEQYARTGNPGIGPSLGADGRPTDDGPSQMVQSLQMKNVTIVRLTQALNGKLLNVELVRPSSDPVMDAEVMRELRAGETVLPTPPSSGAGIKDPMHTVWAFQLVIDIAPPAPVLGATFDDSMLWDKQMRDQLDVRLPLSRRILKQVTLLSVD